MANHLPIELIVHGVKVARAAERLRDAAIRFARISGADVDIALDGEVVLRIELVDAADAERLDRKHKKSRTVN